PAARAHAVYSLAHLRLARAVPALRGALADAASYVRAGGLRGVSRAVSDSAQIAPPEVIARIRPVLGDRDGHVRVNALRALASFQDSTLVGLALPLVTDRDVNVAVQAETTLGALGGARAAAQLEARLASPRFALRRQAAIALAQADSAAGVAAAAELARDRDWRWRSVAAEALGAARDRAASDTCDDARLSAVAALGAIAATGPEGRAAVASRFVARTPRADDYQVRRLAAEKLPDATARWGPAAPIETERSLDDYRAVV